MEIALRAAFPEIAKRIAAEAFGGKAGRARLVVAVKGGLPAADRLKLSNFLAEYGCSDPEEAFSADGDWTCAFDFTPERAGGRLCESAEDPAAVVVRVPRESDKECWVGSFRKMQDLRAFDGGEVARAFATDRYSKGADAERAARWLAEGSELVLKGDVFKVARSYVQGGRVVAEARRVVGEGQAVYDFPADLAERLRGPCGLPRRDEEMFREWTSRAGRSGRY